MEVDRLKNGKDAAKQLRLDILKMALNAGSNGAHLGGSLSCVEILTALYNGIMQFDPGNPSWEERDRFILSKGHVSIVYYAALCRAGYFSEEELLSFNSDGSPFPTHSVANANKGIEISSGSLGWGLSIGIGYALAARKKNAKWRTYVLLGDGECNEGSVWEAFMTAARMKLDNLTAIIDCNGMQLDGANAVMQPDKLQSMLDACGWKTATVGGHDVFCLNKVISQKPEGKPYVVITKTVKGKGVSFMENNCDWHHGRISAEQYEASVIEVISNV